MYVQEFFKEGSKVQERYTASKTRVLGNSGHTSQIANDQLHLELKSDYNTMPLCI